MTHLIFDHRSQVEDRRSWERVPVFPVTDSNDIIIHEDRRQSAERRGYRLEEIIIDDDSIRNLSS